MKTTTLCFCVKDDKVLLAMKKRGFGAGKWNGYGGKVNDGESIAAATVRELQEESSLVVRERDLEQVAIITFYFAEKRITECHVYKTGTWQNEAVETEEMWPQWYATTTLPFTEMWAADVKWIPMVLAGERFTADVVFNEDGTILKEFRQKPTQFDSPTTR